MMKRGRKFVKCARRIAGILVLSVGLSFVCAAMAHGQIPVGPEFHANDFGKNPSGDQSVGVAAGGEFLVVWQQIIPDGKHDGLWSQWFSPSGQPLRGNRFLQVSESQSFNALVSRGSHGGVLVLWRETHYTNFGEWDALVGGELLPDGSWALPPRRITFLEKLGPRFASLLPDGGYAIALLGARPTHTSEDRTFLLLTDANLKVTRGPIPVSPNRRTIQEVGGLAMSPAGELLVTWTEAETTILAQLFSSAGRPLAKAFKVPAEGTLPQYAGAAAPLGSQGYVIIWSENLGSEGIPDLRMRLLGPTGAPRSADLRLDPVVRFRGLQEVASDPAGNFLVVWQEGGAPPDGSWDIFGRLYYPDGAPFGPKVRLNQHVANDQTTAQVAAGPNGTFVVVWQSAGQNGDIDGIYGRVFAVPAAKGPGPTE
jgi:hypothetical protein